MRFGSRADHIVKRYFNVETVLDGLLMLVRRIADIDITRTPPAGRSSSAAMGEKFWRNVIFMEVGYTRLDRFSASRYTLFAVSKNIAFLSSADIFLVSSLKAFQQFEYAYEPLSTGKFPSNIAR